MANVWRPSLLSKRRVGDGATASRKSSDTAAQAVQADRIMPPPTGVGSEYRWCPARHRRRWVWKMPPTERARRRHGLRRARCLPFFTALRLWVKGPSAAQVARRTGSTACQGKRRITLRFANPEAMKRLSGLGRLDGGHQDHPQETKRNVPSEESGVPRGGRPRPPLRPWPRIARDRHWLPTVR